MSCVHYQFKSAMDYKTLTFEGLHISVGDLKAEIMEREKISSASFDLQLTNAQTKVPYEEEGTLIPRNSSVIVARVPAKDPIKLPKIQDSAKLAGGVAARPGKMVPSVGVGDQEADLSNPDLTEDDKRKKIMALSQAAYDPSKYVKRNALMTGAPPPTFICSRCQKSGHWPKNCPLNNVRISTGIPSWELVDALPNEPHAYQTKQGRWVMPRMHMQARLIGKKEKPPFLEDDSPQGTPTYEEAPKVEVPAELKCGLCGELMNHAVLISCCGYSFCDECIRNKLLENEKRECPQCKSLGTSLDSLVPNAQLRQAVNKFQTQEVSSTQQPPPNPSNPAYSGLRISLDKPASSNPTMPLPGILQATLSKFLPSSHPSAHLAPLHPSGAADEGEEAASSTPPSSLFPSSRPQDPPMAAIAPMQVLAPGVPTARVLPATSMGYPASAYHFAAPTLAPPGVHQSLAYHAPGTQPPVPGLMTAGLPPPPGLGIPPPPVNRYSRSKNEFNDAWERYLAKKDRRRRRKERRTPSSDSASSSQSETDSDDDRRHRHRRDEHHHRRRRRSYTPSPSRGYRESRRHRRSRTRSPRTPSPGSVLGYRSRRERSPTSLLPANHKEQAEMFIYKNTHGRGIPPPAHYPPSLPPPVPGKPASLLQGEFLPPPGFAPPPGYVTSARVGSHVKVVKRVQDVPEPDVLNQLDKPRPRREGGREGGRARESREERDRDRRRERREPRYERRRSPRVRSPPALPAPLGRLKREREYREETERSPERERAQLESVETLTLVTTEDSTAPETSTETAPNENKDLKKKVKKLKKKKVKGECESEESPKKKVKKEKKKKRQSLEEITLDTEVPPVPGPPIPAVLPERPEAQEVWGSGSRDSGAVRVSGAGCEVVDEEGRWKSVPLRLEAGVLVNPLHPHHANASPPRKKAKKKKDKDEPKPSVKEPRPEQSPEKRSKEENKETESKKSDEKHKPEHSRLEESRVGKEEKKAEHKEERIPMETEQKPTVEEQRRSEREERRPKEEMSRTVQPSKEERVDERLRDKVEDIRERADDRKERKEEPKEHRSRTHVEESKEKRDRSDGRKEDGNKERSERTEERKEKGRREERRDGAEERKERVEKERVEGRREGRGRGEPKKEEKSRRSSERREEKRSEARKSEKSEPRPRSSRAESPPEERKPHRHSSSTPDSSPKRTDKEEKKHKKHKKKSKKWKKQKRSKERGSEDEGASPEKQPRTGRRSSSPTSVDDSSSDSSDGGEAETKETGGHRVEKSHSHILTRVKARPSDVVVSSSDTRSSRRVSLEEEPPSRRKVTSDGFGAGISITIPIKDTAAPKHTAPKEEGGGSETDARLLEEFFGKRAKLGGTSKPIKLNFRK